MNKMANKVHIKRPYCFIVPNTRITECGFPIGYEIKYWEYAHSNRVSPDKWCKTCLKVFGVSK